MALDRLVRAPATPAGRVQAVTLVLQVTSRIRNAKCATSSRIATGMPCPFPTMALATTAFANAKLVSLAKIAVSALQATSAIRRACSAQAQNSATGMRSTSQMTGRGLIASAHVTTGTMGQIAAFARPDGLATQAVLYAPCQVTAAAGQRP